MKRNFLILVTVFLFIIFLIGCKQKVIEDKTMGKIIEKQETTTEEEKINEELEKEFNDDLDSALEDLEEIENI